MTNICIIGAGYVGLTYAAGLALKGFHVALVDINERTIGLVNKGCSPIDEPGIELALANGVQKGLIRGTTSLSSVFQDVDLILICVGTYCDDVGNIDLSQVKSVACSIRDCFRNYPRVGYKVVCVKSTVICGTTDSVVLPIIEASGKKAGADFGVAMSPEFLKEGSALDDILHPDKIVIGGVDQRSTDVVRRVLQAFLAPGEEGKVLETDVRTAELIKYAQNSFLATKISFINEISRLAEAFGVNVGMVARALGMDSRISPKFLNAGPGFGGSCFPKDVRALYTAGKRASVDPVLLKAVLEVNERQKQHVLSLLSQARTVKGLQVAVLGLAFKAGTGDTRESVSRTVVAGLVEAGAARVVLHDPSSYAREEFKRDYPPSNRIMYSDRLDVALKDAGACIILTEWPEYQRLCPADFAGMGPRPLIIDSRRILPRAAFENECIEIVTLGESGCREFKP